MKLQTGATQVATRTAQLMQATRAGHKFEQKGAIAEPTWFRVVLQHPPTHQLLPKVRQLKKFQGTQTAQKNQETEFFATRNKKTFSTNPKHLYRLEDIKFQEDEIRELFYTHHPWELARPRVMIEQDGETVASAARVWSQIDFPDLALSGENVVQRTLYLAQQPEYAGRGWREAYNAARLEFYRARVQQQAEADVAAEEALLFGAILDKSAIAHGVEREQAVIDKYTGEALEASKALQSAQQEQRSKFEDTTPQEMFD